MKLFDLCLNPLLQTLETGLRGIKTGRDQNQVAVTAYADEVTVFLTSPADAQKSQEILHIYETATGARVNRQKSRAQALGGWDMKTQILYIPYQTDVNILGFKFTNKVNVAANENWSTVTSRVRVLVQDTYHRDLSLDRRRHFVHA